MRGTCKFKIKGKLAPRYVDLFKIIDRKGELAYQLKLPVAAQEMFTSSKRATTNGRS
jgi:hypothetical protein